MLRPAGQCGALACAFQIRPRPCRSASVYGCTAAVYGGIAAIYGDSTVVYGSSPAVHASSAAILGGDAAVYGGSSVMYGGIHDAAAVYGRIGAVQAVGLC
eukprot:16739-Rhodomonas_salina.1